MTTRSHDDQKGAMVDVTRGGGIDRPFVGAPVDLKGPFGAVDDLRRVPGVPAELLPRIRDKLKV